MILTFMAKDRHTSPDKARPPVRTCITGRPDGYRKLDIVVKPEQRIEDVYRQLLEHGFFLPVCQKGQLSVYSMRQRAYVNPLLTFRQGEIYAGDILVIGQTK